MTTRLKVTVSELLITGVITVIFPVLFPEFLFLIAANIVIAIINTMFKEVSVDKKHNILIIPLLVGLVILGIYTSSILIPIAFMVYSVVSQTIQERIINRMDIGKLEASRDRVNEILSNAHKRSFESKGEDYIKYLLELEGKLISKELSQIIANKGFLIAISANNYAAYKDDEDYVLDILKETSLEQAVIINNIEKIIFSKFGNTHFGEKTLQFLTNTLTDEIHKQLNSLIEGKQLESLVLGEWSNEDIKYIFSENNQLDILWKKGMKSVVADYNISKDIISLDYGDDKEIHWEGRVTKLTESELSILDLTNEIGNTDIVYRGK